MKPVKQKVCKESLGGCGGKFTPFQSMQKACNIHCAINMARQHGVKVADTEHKKRKKEFYANDRPRQLKLAQASFNAFIRERDKNLPCISCGTTAPVEYCAGHYRTRGGAPQLRFNQFNVNKQCNKHCNMELSGNIVDYRINLVKKFGVEKVEELESTNEPVKLSCSEIRDINAYYKRLLKSIRAV